MVNNIVRAVVWGILQQTISCTKHRRNAEDKFLSGYSWSYMGIMGHRLVSAHYAYCDGVLCFLLFDERTGQGKMAPAGIAGMDEFLFVCDRLPIEGKREGVF